MSDLRTLRDLAERLVQFDAVTFLQYLENVRAVEGGRSTWMFHSAAHIVFAEARRRVYRVAYTPGLGEKRKRDGDHALGPDDGHQPSKQPSAQQQQQQQQQVQGSPSASSAGIEPVLEPLPKWNLLLEVMEEIQEARAAAASRLLQPAETDQQRAADEAVAAAPVVVFAQDAHTVAQLKEVLKAHGCTPLMTALYEHFLLQRLQGRRGPPAGGGRYEACFCVVGFAGQQPLLVAVVSLLACCCCWVLNVCLHRGSRGDGAPAPIRGKAPGEEQVYFFVFGYICVCVCVFVCACVFMVTTCVHSHVYNTTYMHWYAQDAHCPTHVHPCRRSIAMRASWQQSRAVEAGPPERSPPPKSSRAPCLPMWCLLRSTPGTTCCCGARSRPLWCCTTPAWRSSGRWRSSRPTALAYRCACT